MNWRNREKRRDKEHLEKTALLFIQLSFGMLLFIIIFFLRQEIFSSFAMYIIFVICSYKKTIKLTQYSLRLYVFRNDKLCLKVISEYASLKLLNFQPKCRRT